jgi:hypothetical protein
LNSPPVFDLNYLDVCQTGLFKSQKMVISFETKVMGNLLTGDPLSLRGMKKNEMDTLNRIAASFAGPDLREPDAFWRF